MELICGIVEFTKYNSWPLLPAYLLYCKHQTKYGCILLPILTAILQGRCRCVAQGHSLSGRPGICICPTNSGTLWMSFRTGEGVRFYTYKKSSFIGTLLPWQCVLVYPPKFSGVSRPIFE